MEVVLDYTDVPPRRQTGCGLRNSPPMRSSLLVLLTGVMLCAQFASMVGIPAARFKSSDDSRPFPCQDRPCGCHTYEACWAGDCCCFTLGQKHDWAAKRGLEAPAHSKVKGIAKTARLGKSEPVESCCSLPKSTVKWVSGAFVSACRGTCAEGISAAAILLPPMKPIALSVFQHSPMSVDAPLAEIVSDRADSPPTPPPKRF